MKPSKSLPIDDPVIAASVERALEPYKKLLSPAMIERFREETRLLLTGHPYAIALANQIRPKKAKSKSDDRLVEPVKAAEEEEPARSSGKGEPR